MKTVCIILLLLAVGAYSESCQGRCGNRDDTKPCQCNSSCEKYGDCCSDYSAICKSCQNRCGEGFLQSKPCQCNDECPSHGNCCSDYDDLCGGGGGVTDDELRELTESFLEADVNNVWSQITIDLQGKCSSGDCAPGPLFTDVPESALSGPTISTLIDLQDNYIPEVEYPEDEEPGEIQEVEAFLDAVMDTQVMALAESFLVEKGIYTGNLRDKVKEIWFYLYSRAHGPLGSSGFEHDFVGEIKDEEVSGFHNWVYLYTEEVAGHFDYQGYSKMIDFDGKGEIIDCHFTWLGYPKTFGGMFIGTSPELELATYTVCFLARPDSKCPAQMAGHQFEVQTWTLNSGGKVLVGSAYPDI